MKTNQRQITKRLRLSPAELSAASFVATLIVAAIAICMHVDSPAIWTFLGTAIATSATRLGSRSDV